MDSAIYDFSGHLTASSGDLFDKQTPRTLTSQFSPGYTQSSTVHCLGLHLSLLSALSGERPCLEPFCIPFQLQTELSAHSLIN